MAADHHRDFFLTIMTQPWRRCCWRWLHHWVNLSFCLSFLFRGQMWIPFVLTGRAHSIWLYHKWNTVSIMQNTSYYANCWCTFIAEILQLNFNSRCVVYCLHSIRKEPLDSPTLIIWLFTLKFKNILLNDTLTTQSGI